MKKIIVKYYQGSDTCWIVIDEDTDTVLCETVKEYPYMINYPIAFASYEKAEKWINTGCLAEIQEGTQNLRVGFVKEFVTNLNAKKEVFCF